MCNMGLLVVMILFSWLAAASGGSALVEFQGATIEVSDEALALAEELSDQELLEVDADGWQVIPDQGNLEAAAG